MAGARSFAGLLPPRKDLWGKLPDGTPVYLVDGELIRDKVDPDFVTWGSHAQESYIPEGEVWIDDTVLPGEIEYLARNAGKEESYQHYFDDPETLNHSDIEADEWEIILVAPLPDFGPIKVWVVDGEEVRKRFKPDWRMGGNGEAYKFIPPGQVWIENTVSETERPAIILHEVAEMLDMLEGAPYLRAHRRVTVEVEGVVRADPSKLAEVWSEQEARAWRVMGGEPDQLSKTDRDVIETLKAAGLYDSLAELVAKDQPGAAAVHVTTALGNEDAKPKKRKAKLFSAITGIDTLVNHPAAIAKRAADGVEGACICDTDPEGCPQHGEKARAAEKRAAPRSLKPIDGKYSHSPFSYDPQAMDKLKPEHVQSFLAALTKPEEIGETRSVRLNGLHAIQDRVEHDKVNGMAEARAAGDEGASKPVTVARWAGKNYIADGHHRAAAAWLNGEHSIEARYVNLGTAGDKQDEPTDKRNAETVNGDWSVRFKIDKAYSEQHAEAQIIFGWASVAERDGQIIIDKQGDMIPPAELENGVYEYVLTSREHDNMHTEAVTGALVESMVFTKAKQEALGIYGKLRDDQGRVLDTAWWAGWRVDTPTWAAFKRGELPELSIGGSSLRVPV